MCEHRLRNRSAGTTGHGTTLGAAGYFVPALAIYTPEKHLAPEKRGGENIERSVFNLEAKKCDEEGLSVVKVYVSTGRTYTKRTLQPSAREGKRISG
jgi:hypothetical protein